MRDPAARRPALAVARWQERVEGAPVGRGVISAFVVVTIASLVVWNLPESQLQRDLAPTARAYVNTVGLDQNWGIFAPDPRREVLALEARLTYLGGRTETWHPPTSGNFVGAYREYRWRKWVEHARLDARSELWEPLARYVARHHRHGDGLIAVTLVRRWYEVPPPGPGAGDRPAEQEFAFYSLTITPEMLEEMRR